MMKTMKKFGICGWMLLVCSFLMIGCGDEKTHDKYDFQDVLWYRELEADVEYIYFGSDGEFSYYCSCGSPVDDYDMYDQYTYQPEKQTIQLKGVKSFFWMREKIVIQSCDETTLELKNGNEIRIFEREVEQEEKSDCVQYEGKSYVPLKDSTDMFRYDYAGELDWKTDVVYPIEHPEWNMVYVNGKMYIQEEQEDEIKEYYFNDENYDWSIIIYEGEKEDTIPVTMEEETIKELYQLNEKEKEFSIYFDDMETFGVLEKRSKDGIISARASLAYYENVWYWRTEETDESKEHWPEYVFELPKGIVEQIQR